MPQHKDDLIAQTYTMLNQMYDILLEAGVDDKIINLAGIDLYDFKIEIIREGHKFLEGAYYGPYAKVIETKKLLPDYLWKRYQLWGDFNEHQEVVQLRKHLESLRKRFNSNNRPDLFKRTKRNESLKKAATKKGTTPRAKGASAGDESQSN